IILSLVDNSSYQLYTTPLCLAISFYFAAKKSGERIAKSKISLIVSHLLLAVVNEEVTQQTLDNFQGNNFEDGLQYYAAVAADCDLIVTENGQDFYFSKMPVYSCEELLKTHYK
ncbi:MAG: twitching motility protein PilT, partial [Bacteroidota bacterium]